jgi:putative transposase
MQCVIPLHPQPLRNFDYKGLTFYSLTWNCDYRQPFFTQSDRVDLVRAQFLRAYAETDMAIDAYCFMPDHVHQLIHGTTLSADAKKFIRKTKQYSGFNFSKQFHQKLWQRYGDDHILRRDDEPKATLRYILENPIRKGLVVRPQDYPYTGSQLYTMDQLLEWAYGS